MGWKIRWTSCALNYWTQLAPLLWAPDRNVCPSVFSCWLMSHLLLFCAGLIWICLWCMEVHAIGHCANGSTAAPLPSLISMCTVRSCHICSNSCFWPVAKRLLREPLLLCNSWLFADVASSISDDVFPEGCTDCLSHVATGDFLYFYETECCLFCSNPLHLFFFFCKRHLKGSLVQEHRLWLQLKHETGSLCLWPTECFAS